MIVSIYKALQIFTADMMVVMCAIGVVMRRSEFRT